MPKRRPMSAKAIAYAKVLRDQIGSPAASEISRKSLGGIDAFEEYVDPVYSFHKKENLSRLSSEQGTLLINALLDVAGRRGRRRNNARNNRGRF